MNILFKIIVMVGWACLMPVAVWAQGVQLVTIGQKTDEYVEFCDGAICLMISESTASAGGWCSTEHMAQNALRHGAPQAALNEAVVGANLVEDLIRTLGSTGSNAYVGIYRCTAEDDEADDDTPVHAMVCAWPAIKGAKPFCASADLY